MSNLIKIEYGTVQSKVVITKPVMSINKPHFNKSGVLMIPKDDIYRSKLFSDPDRNSKKFIFIYLDNTQYKVDELHDIYIDVRTNKIYLSGMVNIPNHIVSRFRINEINNLYAIHNTLRLDNDTFVDEFPEQLMALNNITGTEKVLEIGANIGRNSFIIAHLLNKMNNYNFVTLESDPNIYKRLLRNKQLNNLRFFTENAALSKRKLIQRGWNTIPSDKLLEGFTNVNIIDFVQLNKKYNIEFDTLVLDCEGAFYYILMDMPEVLDNIKMIIMENDYKDMDHYLYIAEQLKKKNFSNTYTEPGGNLSFATFNNFYEVWKRDKPVVEPVVEPIVEPVVESIVESVVKPVVEPIVESVVEPVVEPIVEPIVESVVEPVVESVVESVIESVFEPVVEPVVEPIVEPVIVKKKTRAKRTKK